MPILLNYKNVEKRSPTLSAKAEDIPLSNQRHHSPAFNTVHIIAAIIGIAGAVAAAITIFLLCKRKRSKTQAHSNKSGTKHEYSSNNSNNDDVFGSQTNSSHSHSNSQTNYHRFDQFANDFDGNNGSSGQDIASVEDVSPTMQQYQLQLKLLQQQHQERRAYQQNQPQNQLVQVPSQPGQQTTTLSTNTLSLPPPPYYP
ncbi:hypothetical protein A0J61_05725 [Choanephora cucurbitarum]|uniref:Uncharacterized protein n=1 Tax=Choanephora cucurbitarum TaxID=101091 RepID=A0A1C7NAT1_9FUNG|nr:hypothetical protein A0J61_05725 [Choanephora cucurbitarum]